MSVWRERGCVSALFELELCWNQRLIDISCEFTLSEQRWAVCKKGKLLFFLQEDLRYIWGKELQIGLVFYEAREVTHMRWYY